MWLCLTVNLIFIAKRNLYKKTYTLCCHESFFELHFIFSKEVDVTKKEPEDLKSHEKKNDLVIIKTEPSSPIQEVMCREESRKLFESLFERK